MQHELDNAPVSHPADRRIVRRVAVFGAAAVAVTALATAGVAGTAAADPSAPGGRIVLGVPAVSASESPSAAASDEPTAAGDTATSPQLRIAIGYQRVERTLSLTITFAGSVVEPYSSETNQPLTFPTPAKRDIGLGETLTWGDGSNADAPSEGKRCPQGQEKRTVHDIEDSYTISKTYAEPGTYAVNYSYFACGLADGKISGALEIVVP